MRRWQATPLLSFATTLHFMVSVWRIFATCRQRTNRHKPQFTGIGDDLVVARKTRRTSGGGIWLVGTLNGHRFDALVFAEHAEYPDYELDDSRISKLWLKGLHGGKTVANFDRGWDVRPTTKIAQAIVDFLAAGLAEHVYGN